LKAKGKYHHCKNKESKTSNKATTSSNKMASSNKVTSKSKVGTWAMTNNKGNGEVVDYGVLKCASQGCFFNIAMD